MISNNFKHVNNWVFDLDNTLYSPKVCLFDQIEKKMIKLLKYKPKFTLKETIKKYLIKNEN